MSAKFLSKIFLFLLGCRILAALTNLSTNHPDEWFQTVEFGQFLSQGFASRSGEFMTHMRNLTWPTLLSLVITLSQFISPGSFWAKVFAIKFTTALIDCAELMCFFLVLKNAHFGSEKLKRLSTLIIASSWFLIPESVRASQEHLSAAAFWIGYHSYTRSITKPSQVSSHQSNNWNRIAWALLAGTFFALTGAFRFASGTLGVGALIAVFISQFTKPNAERRASRSSAIALFVGAVSGVVLGGIADTVYYGRPWEGLWMYLQFNVFTGQSASLFGRQTVVVYFDYFKGLFAGPFRPFFILSFAFVPAGLLRGLRRISVPSFAFLFFVVSHSLIGHKEPRFMAPVILLFIWHFIEGLGHYENRLNELYRAKCVPFFSKFSFVRKAAILAIASLFFWNGALLIKQIWGETFRVTQNYLSLPGLIQNNPKTCAVITVKRPWGTLLPYLQSGQTPSVRPPKDQIVPTPALAYFPSPSHQYSSEYVQKNPLIWVMRAPTCSIDTVVLVQPQRAEEFWASAGKCELMETGILRLVSKQRWPQLISVFGISGPWYRCPSAVLSLFAKSEVRNTVVRELPHIEVLPPFGVSAERYNQMAWGTLDPKSPEARDGTFGEW